MASDRRPRAEMEPAGLVLRDTPAAALGSFITPAAQHYVLAHHGIAHCSAADWTLVVDGLVERPLRLDIAELRSRPARTVTALLECAGNPEDPDKPTRIVGNASWRGVPLVSLLEEAGASPDAGYVWLRGEDSGSYAGEATDGYLKDIPATKARDADVVIAYEMNGEPLAPEHGFPLRALVPGYYGTNSVKWLSTVSVQAERASSLFTTRLYNVEVDGVRRPVWELAVNSRLVTPQDGAQLPGGPVELGGWAWGHAPVARVEISVDGGATFFPADLDLRRTGAPWQGFRATWQPSGPGEHTIVVRATDETGAVQPEGVHVNQVQRVAVTILAA
ncbi:MAG: molybdopterin-dependent oxidoreductase [Acidimicrobiales bacterium]